MKGRVFLLPLLIVSVGGSAGEPMEACYRGQLELTAVCPMVCGSCCPRAKITTATGQVVPVGRTFYPLDQLADGEEHLFCGFHYEERGSCQESRCNFFLILQVDGQKPEFPHYDPETGLLFLPQVEVKGDCYSATLRIPMDRLPELLLKAEKLPSCQK